GSYRLRLAFVEGGRRGRRRCAGVRDGGRRRGQLDVEPLDSLVDRSIPRQRPVQLVLLDRLDAFPPRKVDVGERSGRNEITRIVGEHFGKGGDRLGDLPRFEIRASQRDVRGQVARVRQQSLLESGKRFR